MVHKTRRNEHRSVLMWLTKQVKDWRRRKEADRRRWAGLGRMIACGREWSEAKWRREIRRLNRLYRIAKKCN